ncbi:MAG: hypothetical protein ACRDZ5_07550 [Acidimicrobiales bacterium]
MLYADERSFTFMTPQGHMFGGWITFSPEELSGGHDRAGTRALAGERPGL